MVVRHRGAWHGLGNGRDGGPSHRHTKVHGYPRKQGIGYESPGRTKISDVSLCANVVGLNRLTRIIFYQASEARGNASAEVKEEKNEKKIVALCAKGATEDANRVIRQRLADAATIHDLSLLGTSCQSGQVIADGYIAVALSSSPVDWLTALQVVFHFPPDDRYENAGKLGCLRFLFLGPVISLRPPEKLGPKTTSTTKQ